MKRATDLTRQELEILVDGVQQSLYLDVADNGKLVWSPDKEWDGADACEGVARLLNRIGIVPVDEEPYSPFSIEPSARCFVFYDDAAGELLGGRFYRTHREAELPACVSALLAASHSHSPIAAS